MTLLRLARLALVLCSVTAAARQAAAQTPDPKTTAGLWRMTVQMSTRVPTVPEKQMLAQLEAIAASIRAMPLLNPPVGYSVEPHVITGGRDAGTKVLPGEYFLFVIPHTRKPDGTINITPMGSGFEGLRFGLSANNVGCLINTDNWAHFDGADDDLHFAPVVGSFQGHVTYNDCIFFTKRTASPVIPASRERVMRAVIRQYHELPGMVREYQQQLDAMSPAERASPAWMDVVSFGTNSVMQKVGGPLFGAPGQKDKDGVALQAVVTFNPAFFDATRPGDVQSLTVTVPCSVRFRSQSQWCAGYGTVFDRLLASLDWNALSAVVRP